MEKATGGLAAARRGGLVPKEGTLGFTAQKNAGSLEESAFQGLSLQNLRIPLGGLWSLPPRGVGPSAENRSSPGLSPPCWDPRNSELFLLKLALLERESGRLVPWGKVGRAGGGRGRERLGKWEGP